MTAYSLIGISVLVWLSLLIRMGLVAARMFQIDEYEPARLRAWSRQRAWFLPHASVVAAIVALLVGIVWSVLGAAARDMAASSLLLGALTCHLMWRRVPAKKPLVYTARMRRLLAAAGVIAVVVAIVIGLLIATVPLAASVVISAAACLGVSGLTAPVLVVANWTMAPVEAVIRRGYVQRAQERLDAVAPSVIGVAGSYGKTSTKHITAALLTPSIRTLATPKSYNTLMGVTRTINENLEQAHKAFVVEMDAYAPGEIASMCRLVHPSIGIVTAVGPQHLERFGSVDAIADALYELIDALPANGTAIVYAGDEPSHSLATRAALSGRRIVSYGHAGTTPWPLDVTARDVVLGAEATEFVWEWAAEQVTATVRIPLLGSHNILNVSAALAVVHALDVSLADAVAAAARLDPVPHRLQRIVGAGGVTIIDDSYNANPIGIHNGLDVLDEIAGHAKILVTPGLVELGTLQDEENRRLGEHAARVCDRVILVGTRQTEPIYAGLQAGGLDPEHVHRVQSLDEVTATLSRVTGQGDVVLFANDLPDVYLELG